jgi:hypothetical protein
MLGAKNTEQVLGRSFFVFLLHEYHVRLFDSVVSTTPDFV